MAKIWRWVAVISALVLVVGLALLGVAYTTGGNVERLMATTDIFDMTKFASREQLETYVTQVFQVAGRLFG